MIGISGAGDFGPLFSCKAVLPLEEILLGYSRTSNSQPPFNTERSTSKSLGSTLKATTEGSLARVTFASRDVASNDLPSDII